MISNDKVTEIYFIIDEFFKEFDQVLKEYTLENSKKRKRNRSFTLSESEIMTFMILFHQGGFRNFKWFYINYIQKHMKSEFPKTVSYNRFVELQKKVCIPLAIFIKTVCLGQCTGISFIDSTTIKVCHIKRQKQNKVFKNITEKGRGSLGWLYGFKLHLIVNDKDEILAFC